MSDAPALIYLEADDEITTVLRRLRAADPGRVILVAPGRSRATSSVIALRLLAGEGRDLAVVGDALTRSLAAEAGLAAYGTVDEARRAVPGAAPPAVESRHAAIHVVRGARVDAGAPTLAAAAVPVPPRSASDETRAVALPETRSAPPGRRGARTPGWGLAAALALLAIFLAGAAVAGATVLPGATITIAPRTERIGPVTYDILIDEPDEVTGTVEAQAMVSATGSYTVQEPASGEVVLFNWTFVPVTVPAGSFVAAGEQAFATGAEVAVPRGRLTAEGTIAAGEIAVAVVAAAPGEAGNVAAEAIDTVVSQEIDQRLRGFPENTRRTVTNPDATAGGVDRSGPEFVQADVDTAVNALTAELGRLATEALPEADGRIVLIPAEAAAPTITGADGLVGTRDQPEATISGSLAWSAFVVDPEEVRGRARDRFDEEAQDLADGLEPLPEETTVGVGAATLLPSGSVQVEATVLGAATAVIDAGVVVERATGLSAEEAVVALADIGPARVELWPGWVTTVPDLEWRISVRVEGAAVPSALPSSSP